MLASPAWGRDYAIEMLETSADIEAIEPEWREFLCEEVQGSNFFNDPLHIVAQLELEPQLRLWTMVLRRNGRICCIAPFHLHDTCLNVEFSVFTLAAFRTRMLKVFGGQFVIAADADAAHCFQTIFDCVWSHRSDFGMICLENLPVATFLWRYCHAALIRDSRFRTFLASSQIDTDHQVYFPVSHDAFMSTLSYDTRRRLRRVTRRLQDKGQLRLERITESDDVPGFLDRLDDVYRDTWQAQSNGYSRRNTSAYIRYLSQIARAGFLRSYLLAINDLPIAYALGYQYDGAYYFLETGYRQAWADSSPGTALMNMFFEDLFRHHSPKLLDFIQGDQTYKRSFSNCQRETASLYLAPPNRWRMILWVQSLLHAMSRMTVCTLNTLKIDRMLRKRFRRAVR